MPPTVASYNLEVVFFAVCINSWARMQVTPWKKPFHRYVMKVTTGHNNHPTDGSHVWGIITTCHGQKRQTQNSAYFVYYLWMNPPPPPPQLIQCWLQDLAIHRTSLGGQNNIGMGVNYQCKNFRGQSYNLVGNGQHFNTFLSISNRYSKSSKPVVCVLKRTIVII